MHVFPCEGVLGRKGEFAHGVYSISVLEMHSRPVGEFCAPFSALPCLAYASLGALHSSQMTDFQGEPQRDSHLT